VGKSSMDQAMDKAEHVHSAKNFAPLFSCKFIKQEIAFYHSMINNIISAIFFYLFF
jgi:hypothetical protein